MTIDLKTLHKQYEPLLQLAHIGYKEVEKRMLLRGVATQTLDGLMMLSMNPLNSK